MCLCLFLLSRGCCQQIVTLAVNKMEQQAKTLQALTESAKISVMLSAIMEDPKRKSINQSIRDMTHKLKKLIQIVEEGAKDALKSRKCDDVAIQATAATVDIAVGTTPQKNDKGTQGTPQEKRGQQKRPPTVQASEVGAAKMISTHGPAEKWSVVARKGAVKGALKRDGQPRKVRSRQEALIVGIKGDATSYVEVLKRMKADPELQDLGKSVTSVRRTNKGELLLGLARDCRDGEQHGSKLGVALGEAFGVRFARNSVTVECRDLDEATTRDEVALALAKAGCSVRAGDVVGLRKAYGGTQTATVRVAAEEAKGLLECGRVRIGWVFSRVREPQRLVRCYRCLEFGHISRNCTGPEDRSKICWKCGGEGHKAIECQGSPCCLICKTSSPSQANHATGGKGCPAFRRAMTQRT